jgi:hypothetical protein
MNKQMIELYKQALEFAYTNISKEYWNTDNFHAVVSGKFAELIVAKCVAQCEFVASQAEITNKGEMARKTKATADYCAFFIKEYFGVEE